MLGCVMSLFPQGCVHIPAVHGSSYCFTSAPAVRVARGLDLDYSTVHMLIPVCFVNSNNMWY